MIDKIISDLSSKSPCQFNLVENNFDNISFYRASSKNYQRFLVVIKVDKLIPPAELNQLVLNSTPAAIRELPAFSKNTDVVVLFELNRLEDIVKFESEVFSLEEDSYSFKKHVLYYSKEEMELLGDRDASSIAELIKDQSKFGLYKSSPLSESEYGIASRIFIKLPFLSVPVDESDLDDPSSIANLVLKEEGLFELCERFESLIKNTGSNYHKAVEEYIRGEMANSQAED